MNDPIRFDDSLPAFAKVVAFHWGQESLLRNVFLRDASGKLTFVIVGDEYSKEKRAELALAVAHDLGPYVDGAPFSVATPDELFDETLTDATAWMNIHVDHPSFRGEVHLLDRRIVGADWLRRPERPAPPPIRFVFTSLKGGVGRSTALCVLAAHLASQGRRVLTIDMDLEAPGLGNLLLPESTLPKFGLLDYLVELEVGSAIDDQFWADMIGPSWLGQGRGRVDVIPAIGQMSLRFPENVLAKIARAYLASAPKDATQISFADHIRALLERAANPTRYDAVLIDARAGLHETTAAAILGLGAEVLLFGLDQPQTYAGYELLFAHLATLKSNSDDAWQSRFHLIQSKASRDSRSRNRFAETMAGLFSKYLWRSPSVDESSMDPTELRDTFEVEWAEGSTTAVESLIEAEQPPSILAILDDEEFRYFDPISNRDSLANPYYSLAFGSFLEMADAMVASLISSDPNE